jgi:hypothetical protein
MMNDAGRFDELDLTEDIAIIQRVAPVPGGAPDSILRETPGESLTNARSDPPGHNKTIAPADDEVSVTPFEAFEDESDGKKKTWQDFLFPPHLPRTCQLLRYENLAVPVTYLIVGLCQGSSSPLLNVLPLDLGATEAQQTTMFTLRFLPASLKIVFGFLSDSVPIMGYRRKPYMIIGWIIASLSQLILIFASNLHFNPSAGRQCFGASTGEGGNEIPSDAPSIALLSGTTFMLGLGFWVAE